MGEPGLAMTMLVFEPSQSNPSANQPFILRYMGFLDYCTQIIGLSFEHYTDLWGAHMADASVIIFPGSASNRFRGVDFTPGLWPDLWHSRLRLLGWRVAEQFLMRSARNSEGANDASHERDKPEETGHKRRSAVLLPTVDASFEYHHRSARRLWIGFSGSKDGWRCWRPRK